jgi:imidazolonepropionase-like amidohydrolase
MTKTIITNVRVFDGEAVSGPRTFVIDGPTIGGAVADSTDGPAAHTIDGTGHTLLPGLIDAHVHAAVPEDLDTLARHGVTTALDMGAMPPGTFEKLRAAAAEKRTATYLSAGIPAFAPHADIVKFAAMVGMTGLEAHAVGDGAAGGEAYVAARLADGVHHIKAYADEPGLTQEQLDAVARAARAAGKLSVAHALHHGAYERALAARFDVLTHVPLEMALDAKLVDQAVAQGTICVPTLSILQLGEQMAKEHPRPDGRKQEYALARDSVVAMREKGVPILAGSDSNSLPAMPHLHGESSWDEMELLADAGMSPLEVLQASTVLVAKYFSLHDRGSIKPGLRADLVLVEGNPTDQIGDIRKVKHVWIEGENFELHQEP